MQLRGSPGQSGGRGVEAAGCSPAAAGPRAVPARPRGALGAAGSARTRSAAAGSAGTGRCGTGPCPAGGGAAGRSRQPPGKRVSDAAVPRLPRVRVSAGAERGPRQRRRQRSGEPWQPCRARAERQGLRGRPAVRPPDRGSYPGALGPAPVGALCCCLPFPSLYRTAAGPGSLSLAVPRGKKRFSFRHPPKQPAGDGVWLSRPWGCHPTTGTATTYWPRHLSCVSPSFL